MQIRDLSKPVTSKQLNESLAKKFGYKLNLEQFTDVQLEDVRNKLRTKISQFEVSESYDGMNASPEYQKIRLMLDCINTEIMEREVNEGKGDGNLANNSKPYDKVTRGDVIAGRLGKDEMGGKKKKKMESLNLALMVKKAREHSVPSKWIESAIQRIQLGESDQEELVSELHNRLRKLDLLDSQLDIYNNKNIMLNINGKIINSSEELLNVNDKFMEIIWNNIIVKVKIETIKNI